MCVCVCVCMCVCLCVCVCIKQEAQPYIGLNGDYKQSTEMYNQHASYTKLSHPTTAIWWSSTEFKSAWCLGPKDKVRVSVSVSMPV